MTSPLDLATRDLSIMPDTVTVTINDGTLRGKKDTSKNGKTYYSFRGVPFAKPPVGPLRFKVPQPMEPWSGIRDALKDGNICTQFNLHSGQYGGSEDCLYLNVYSPKLPSGGSKDALKPVMFYFHGGGFVIGSNSSKYYGPDYLVDEDVVVVVTNYRLGILGFLCLNDPVAPGNIGLKDQVAALRWVQKNVAKFGGDPNNVTIFGESAGGVSVHFHLLSPLSKGLFQKAITMSGVALNPWSMTDHGPEQALRVAKELGFTGSNPKEVVDFFRGVDHIELTKAAFGHGVSEYDKHRLLIFGFVPTVEMVESEGVKRFLPASPLKLMEEGHYHAVPCILGTTKDEGLLLYLFAELANEKHFKRIEENFEKIVRTDLRLPKNYKKSDEIASKIWKFYMKDNPITKETIYTFLDMYTDILFAEGVHTIVTKLAQHSKAPLYYYNFNVDGKLNTFKTENKVPLQGACHADDLGYLFRISTIDPDLPANSPDAIVRARIAKLWTNFAKTGNPTPQTDALLPVSWPQFTTCDSHYLEIGTELLVKKNYNEDRMKFWEELYLTL